MFTRKTHIHKCRPRAWYKKLKTVATACALSLFALHPVWADDTEIYFSADTSKPNLLFILDASHSMKWWDCEDGLISKEEPCDDGTENGTVTRLERMFNAMDQVLDTLPDDLNVGVMRFGGWDGGRVIYPITDLTQPGVRDEIKSVVREINTVLGTPTVGALEEAYRYFAGQPVNTGRIRAETSQFHSKYFSRVSHPDTYTGGTVAGRGDCQDNDLNNENCENEHITGNPVYKSPIEFECQANHAILLSDGDPNTGHAGGLTIQSYYDTIAYITALNGGVSCKNNRPDNKCGEELTAFMRNSDLSDLPGDQYVTTHAIGFNIQSNWIRDITSDTKVDANGNVAADDEEGTYLGGGGSYFEAQSSTDLANAISGIVDDSIAKGGATFVAPSVTIDQFNPLSHRDEVYLALFRPRSASNWIGNLKKYKFNGADPVLRDQRGDAVVNTATGEFLPESRSFWSTVDDGSDVGLGGAAGKLDVASRKMYSYLETGTVDLTAFGNRMNADNVPAAIIGASNNAERDTILSWLTGFDVLDEDGDGDLDDARHHIGDPLHSNPVVVSYAVEDGETLDKDNLNSLVFFGTNEGFLHAIDTVDGTEEYAFMPKELMSNVAELYKNDSNSTVALQPIATQLQPIGATQSSTNFGGSAVRAIDGNTVGAQNSVTHTNMESQPWLDIDLGEVSDVTSVTVWNRTDCCRERLKDFHVLISETPFAAGSTLTSNLGNPAISSYFHSGELTGDSATVPLVGSGRYVRVQLQGSDFLSLAEVSVTGTTGASSIAGLSRPYGMDGKLTVRTIDLDNDGFIDASASEKAFVYAGMRRGGRNYYSLDVSTKDKPEFNWSILGGQGDFAELGQTWSKLISTKIKVGDTERDVLVFGGGYDPSQDSKETRSADTQGRAIYIVDAVTGALIWSGGHPQNQPVGSSKHYSFANMDYSIPADLAILPDTSTGYMSQIYVGDMGGRLWRFDINNGSDIEDLVDGGIIADFGDDSAAGARRFFATPDLSLSKIDNELILNIAIGSGYRAHPLNKTIKDQFFVYQYPFAGYGDNYGVQRAEPTESSSGSYTIASILDLYNATSNAIAGGEDGDIEEAEAALAMAEGWYIEMESPGEKILDRSSTFEGVIRFVSYVPAAAQGPCAPNLGSSFVYAVNLLDGTPFEDLNEGGGDPNHKDNRKKELPTPGIAPPITTIFVENQGQVTPTDVSGANTIHEWDDVDLLRRWFWAERPY